MPLLCGSWTRCVLTCMGSQEAASAASGDKATFNMPPLPNTPWAAAPDVAAAALAARRLVLSERETALQQWAAALAIESSRRAKAAAAVTEASEQVNPRLSMCCIQHALFTGFTWWKRPELHHIKQFSFLSPVSLSLFS